MKAIIQLADGRIVSGSSDRTMHIWDPDDVDAGAVIFPNHLLQVEDVVELRDGGIATSDDAEIQIWDPADPARPLLTHTTLHTVTRILELADGRLALGSVEGTVEIWDPAAPDAPVPIYTGHGEAWVHALVQLPDGRIASGDADGVIQIWDPGPRP